MITSTLQIARAESSTGSFMNVQIRLHFYDLKGVPNTE